MITKEKLTFFTKVTLAHVITYMLCGMIAMTIFQYEDFIEDLGFRPMDEINSLVILLAQVVRGILFGVVIWWIKDSIIGKKLAWLKLWAILIIVGIISVYAPAPGSIEGFIYLVPVDLGGTSSLFESLSLLEVMIQPLLFSIIVTFQRKKATSQEDIA